MEFCVYLTVLLRKLFSQIVDVAISYDHLFSCRLFTRVDTCEAICTWNVNNQEIEDNSLASCDKLHH